MASTKDETTGMSRLLFLVIRFELLRNLKRRGFLGLTLGIPLLGLLILVGSQIVNAGDRSGGEAENSINIAGYVDLSGVLQDSEIIGGLRPYKSETAALSAIQAGEIDHYWLIPADYLAEGKIIRNEASFKLEVFNNRLIEYAIRSSLIARSAVNQETADRFLNPLAGLAVVPHQIDAAPGSGLPAEESSFGGSFMIVYGFATIFVVSIMFTNGYLLRSIIEEKETKLIEVLIATMQPSTLLIGKVLGFGILGLLQTLFWLLSGYMLLQLAGSWGQVLEVQQAFMNIPLTDLLLLLAYFLLLYFFMAAGFGAIGAISQSMQEGPQFVVIFVLPAMIPLWFSALFAAEPDGQIALVLSLLPVVSPLAMIQRLVISQVPTIEIIISLLLMLASVVAIFWLAGRLFRFQTLLSGRLPKLRELPQILRA